MDFLLLAQEVSSTTLVSGGGAVIAALTGAITYLWRRFEREFDECKQDRARLWQAVAELKQEQAQ